MSFSIPSSAPARPVRSPRNSGGTGLVLNRETDYVGIAQDRIDAVKCAPADVTVLTTPDKRNEPRVPFGLRHRARSAQRRRQAIRHSQTGHRQGKLPMAVLRLKMSAAQFIRSVASVQNAPSCNGWTFWHVERRGKVVPIDKLRERIRADMGYPQGESRCRAISRCGGIALTISLLSAPNSQLFS